MVRLEPVEIWPGWTEPGAGWCGGAGQGGGQPHAQGWWKSSVVGGLQGGRGGDLDGGRCCNVKCVERVGTEGGSSDAGGNRLVSDGLECLYEGRDSHRGLVVHEARGRRQRRWLGGGGCHGGGVGGWHEGLNGRGREGGEDGSRSRWGAGWGGCVYGIGGSGWGTRCRGRGSDRSIVWSWGRIDGGLVVWCWRRINVGLAARSWIGVGLIVWSLGRIDGGWDLGTL